jgi:uncharacterized membrane protein
MGNRFARLGSYAASYWSRFSFVGLAAATVFFAASLTPSLLPRHYAVQGVLSGMAAAAGYGLGKLVVWLWLYLEIPHFPAKVEFASKRITTLVVAIVAASFLWRATVWQNSIRERMDMAPVESAYPWTVAAIAIVTAMALIALGALLRTIWRQVDSRMQRIVPRRVSVVLSTLALVVLVLLVANQVIARAALNVADAVFLQMDKFVDEGLQQPTEPSASGSNESLVDWDDVGRWGKEFILNGPTQQDVSDFTSADAQRPLRVYVGLASRDSVEERASLALAELKRAGGFDRSVLIVATPTGTGWLDPGAVDTIEYLHRGDTAIVSMQYSYLPSWITILVDPYRSRDSAQALFNAVYDHWTTLPAESRPRLYLHGLSLGSLGSESSADAFTLFEDPIQGGVWSGPPFPSPVWRRATTYRNSDSPMWLPRFRDGSMLRFTGRENTLDEAGQRWGPMRFVYIQHASDPMTFFSKDLLYRRPAWLTGQRGLDVSPYLRWYPIVTFLQLAFDLPMATAVPTGFGHNYAPESYIDAWVAVTAPAEWSGADVQRLKDRFADKRKAKE